MSNLHRLTELESRMDEQLHCFYSNEEEPRRGAGVMAGAGIAAGAAGAGLAYKNRAAIKTGAQNMARTGLKKTARGAGVASNMLHKQALRGSGVLGAAAGKGSTILQKASTGLRKVSRGFSAAEVNAIAHLAERIALIELQAEEEIREFKDYGPQRDPAGVQIAGNYSNGFLGGREALLARDKFVAKGQVYRKRDALKDGVKGNLSGSALAAGAVGAGVLGSAGLMKAAASGKLKKGVIRKGGVRAAQVLKRAGRSPGVALGGLLAAGVGGHLAGTRIQRRSADKRLAKREQEG